MDWFVRDPRFYSLHFDWFRARHLTGFFRETRVPSPFVEDLGGSRASLETNLKLPSAQAPHSRPQSLMGAWAQGPGDSGDTGFEVLDFRTSSHCRFKSKLKDSLSKALNHLNLQSLTLLQEQVNATRNFVENQTWPEVLKSRTSNPVSPESPGPRAQAPRGAWGREWQAPLIDSFRGSFRSSVNLSPMFALIATWVWGNFPLLPEMSAVYSMFMKNETTVHVLSCFVMFVILCCSLRIIVQV